MPETLEYTVEAESTPTPPAEPTTGTVFGDADSEGNPLPIPLGALDTTGTALARIWKQFERTTTWPLLMRALGDMWGDIEAVGIALQPMRYVATAEGVWLEAIGATVGRPRGGQTEDDDFRLAIIAEALSIITSGAPDEMIDIGVRLAPEGSLVIYSEPAPAVFVLTITDLDVDRFNLIASIMADMPPAGVGAWLDTYNVDEVAGPGWDPQPELAGAPGWDPQPDDILADHAWGIEIG